MVMYNNTGSGGVGGSKHHRSSGTPGHSTANASAKIVRSNLQSVGNCSNRNNNVYATSKYKTKNVTNNNNNNNNSNYNANNGDNGTATNYNNNRNNNDGGLNGSNSSNSNSSSNSSCNAHDDDKFTLYCAIGEKKYQSLYDNERINMNIDIGTVYSLF
eukprot:Pgem_evm2s4271